MISQPDYLQRDATARLQAINPAHSFIVEAPAGAGKTELLTQRFLALLERVNEPEEIVALTFTNKAAAEMRHRIMGSLQMAHTGIEPAEAHKKITFQLGVKVLQRDQQRKWELLLNGSRLQITTLDAFCSKLARQMPLLSRLGSQPSIYTDAEPLYQQAARQTLEALEKPGPLADAVAQVLDTFDNDAARFESLLIAMLASRDQWLRHARDGVDFAAAEAAFNILISQELHKVLTIMPPGWQSSLMPVAQAVASHLALSQTLNAQPAPELQAIPLLEHWTTPLTADPNGLPRWRAVLQLLSTKGGEIRSVIPSAFGLANKNNKHLKTALKDLLDSLKNTSAADALLSIKKLPNPSYDAQEKERIENLQAVLRLAELHLWNIFKQANEVDFTEIAQRALEALGHDDAPTDLALRLDYQLQHLLVDEFQDTSPTQVQLLHKLTAAWQPDDAKTLFLVGDPMQSIYKFRKADVGLFLKVRDQGLGNLRLQPLRLYLNNRSSISVVEWVNDVFPNVFAADSNPQRGAVQFTPALGRKADTPDCGITWHPIVDVQADDDAPSPASSLAEREAATIVRIIQQTRQAQPAHRIAILVRARTHLEALVEQLRTYHPDLPYQAIEIESLSSRQLIQDLLTLTRALLHRGDRVHWLALLRAPWCGLLLHDLHALSGHDRHASLWDCMHHEPRIATMTLDGQQRLLRVRNALSQAFEQQGRLRLRRWIEHTWQALGGPYCLNSQADLLDAKAYFDVIDQLDQSGNLDFAQLEKQVNTLYAAPNPMAPDTLQIMTVHKSKGLEFDTVIIPGLHKKSPPNDKKLMLWDEVIGADNEEHLVIAPLPFGREADNEAPQKFDYLHQFDTERARNETQRLLYVAVTRAKRRLHLVGCAKPDPHNAGDIKHPAKDSFLGLLWNNAQPHFMHASHSTAEQDSASKLTPTASPRTTEPDAQYNHRLIRLHSGFTTPVQTQPNLPEETRAVHAALSPDQASASNAENTTLADIGTLIHRYLQLIAEDGLDAWSTTRINTLKQPMSLWMQQKAHHPDVAMQAAQTVCEHLCTTLQSEPGRWVLAAHPNALCEQPYLIQQNGTLQTHIIDRMFVLDGVRWIIDYKSTSQVSEDPAEVQHAYIEQLQRYRLLFPSETVRLAVFFTYSGNLIEVTKSVTNSCL
jgi:ATP-dependent exoDNAse (exonuclease V) beta subunit